MSTANSTTSSAGGHTQSGSKIEFETVRGRCNGRVKLFHKPVGFSREMTVVQYGGGFQGWFDDEPERKVTVTNGRPEDVVRELAPLAFEPRLAVVVKKAPLFETQLIDRVLKSYEAQKRSRALAVSVPQVARISSKQIDWLWKQSVVNEVTRKAHLGTATQKDFDALARLRGKVPPPAPISIETETKRVVDFVLSVAHDGRGRYLSDFSSARRHMRDCSRGAYGLKELSGGRFAVVNGKDKPNAVVFRKRSDGRLVLCDANLTKTLQKFVRELYPELREHVEPETQEEIPF